MLIYEMLSDPVVINKATGNSGMSEKVRCWLTVFEM